ncbi:MAG: NADP-dependent malic enzyme [Clostridiales bacterium]|jgi:malate dehydrogenase (oxaloacetate-decarboxylating)|nr:NADP-dependent malic enzyme [Clostridiales bacterium]
MDIREESLQKHYEWQGKIEIKARTSAKSRKELSLAYTPGVAEPCLEIQKDISKSFLLTRRWNTVAVITDGTAVLGLGNIGPEAGMPVMEGKCLLFKEFAGIDAIPLCIRSTDVEEIVNTVRLLCGSFGGVNLEDISAPRCFEIERRLKEICDIPIFHDDQHGTAVVVSAALINACRITGRDIKKISVVINGAGAAGIAVGRMLRNLGVEDLTYCGRRGALYEGRPDINPAQAEAVIGTNKAGVRGSLKDAMAGKDVFIGVSAANLVDEEMVKSMAPNPIIFALANPNPEILPDKAKSGGAAVVGTGRSDYPNQINNVLAFPGIFRGALDARANQITEEMKVAAAYALSALVDDDKLSPDYIIPDAFDERVCPAVALAVFNEAKRAENTSK